MQIIDSYLLLESAHEKYLIGLGVDESMRYPHPLKIYFSDDMAVAEVIENHRCLSVSIFPAFFLGFDEEATGSLALLDNY